MSKKLYGVLATGLAVMAVVSLAEYNAYAGSGGTDHDQKTVACTAGAFMSNYPQAPHVCYNNAANTYMAWIRYTFSEEFRNGQIIKADGTPLKLTDVWLGPGSPGNGDWIRGDKSLDNCGSSSTGIYRFGYLERKTVDFHHGASSGSSTGKGSSVGDTVIVQTGGASGAVGITGNQAVTNSVGKSTSVIRDRIKADSRIVGQEIYYRDKDGVLKLVMSASGSDSVFGPYDSTVKSDYDKAAAVAKAEGGDLGKFEKKSNFCYDTQSDGEATYSGSVSITANGQTNTTPDTTLSIELPASQGSFELSRAYTVNRSGSNIEGKANYKKKDNGTEGTFGDGVKVTGSNSTKTFSGENDSSTSVSINIGETKNYCAKLEYVSHKIRSGGKITTEDWDNTGEVCIEISRPLSISHLDSQTSGIVKYADGEEIESLTSGVDEVENLRVDVESERPLYAAFSHKLTRDEPTFKTTYFDVSRTRNGTGTETNSISFDIPSPASSTQSISYEEKQMDTVSLMPQEESRFYDKLSHPAEVNNKPEVSSEIETSGLDITLHGLDFECSSKFGEAAKFGIYSGNNMGMIGVSKNGAWKYTDNYINDQEASEADVWAKAGDEVKFAHIVCAGANYTAYYNKVNIANKYSFVSSGKNTLNSGARYLFGDEFSEYPSENLVGIKDFLTGDPNKSKNYKLRVSSPSDDNHVVMADEVGSTIAQDITWQDLRFEEGGIKSGGYDGSKKKVATGNVKIPYNYTLKPSASLNNGSTSPYVLAGSNMNYDGAAFVEARENTATGGSAYATKTRDTKTKIIVFSTTTTPSSDLRIVDKWNASDGELCGSSCQQILDVKNGSTVLNASSNINPDAAEPIGSGSTRIQLDGMLIGTHICAVTAVYPADSHGAYGYMPTDSEQDRGLGADAPEGAAWAVSAPACKTVAKKPTLSIEGGMAYILGDTKTSSVRRSDTGSYFGSWAEYGALIGGANNGFSTGAATAYGNLGYAVGINQAVHDSGMSGVDASPNEKKSKTLCIYNTQTIANDGCEAASPETGMADVSSVQTRLNDYLRYILMFFSPASGATVSGYHGGKISGCYWNDSKFETVDGDNSYQCRSDGSAMAYYESDAEISGINGLEMQGAGSKVVSNKTFVIYSKGKITISGDIKLARKQYHGVNEIPNVIIIADDIDITEGVKEIDAWLIAGTRSGSSGIINTCAISDGLNSSRCNTSLVINGMVAAKKVFFNRTAGAGTDNYSQIVESEEYIRRAEIINLPVYNYYWGFAVSNRNSAMGTSYLREIPTRY